VRKAILFVVLLGALASGSAAAAASCPTLHAGQLTIGTDNPAYPPWYGGTPGSGSKWKVSDPTSGKGFESAVAYAVASRLGFKRSQVQWTYVPFNRSFAPGPKSFDFDINQISYSPTRARVVSFSSSYYDVSQAVVVLDGTKIAKVRTLAGLRRFKLGAQLGTTSYAYIQSHVKPATTTSVYQTNAAAVQALKNRQIDGLVVDLPTAFYITGAQVQDATIAGQFEAPGGDRWGMLLAKGSKLTSCLNQALAKVSSSGQLKQLQDQWMGGDAAPALN
jgi:polar amino acid transport system substrate-binding protein